MPTRHTHTNIYIYIYKLLLLSGVHKVARSSALGSTPMAKHGKPLSNAFCVFDKLSLIWRALEGRKLTACVSWTRPTDLVFSYSSIWRSRRLVLWGVRTQQRRRPQSSRRTKRSLMDTTTLRLHHQRRAAFHPTAPKTVSTAAWKCSTDRSNIMLFAC